jgi:cell division septation protein DedD
MAKERRAGLGILDRIVLFAAWLVTCGIVDLLGLYVGQGIQERRIGVEDRVLKLPVTSKPPPEGLRPKAESDLTFYDTLVQPPPKGARADRPARPAAPAGPNAAADAATAPTGSPPAAAAKADAAKADSAKTDSARTEPAKTASARAEPTKAESAKAAPPADRPAMSPSTAVPPGHAAAPRSADVPATATPRAPAAPPATPPSAARPAPAHSTGGGFTVLATPTRNKDEADILAQKLRGKGYDVMVVRVLRDGDNWYRVRIGRYGTAEQATEAMKNLREHEGVPHVFVATE